MKAMVPHDNILHIPVSRPTSDGERWELWHVLLDGNGDRSFHCWAFMPPGEPTHETGNEYLGHVYYDQGLAGWNAVLNHGDDSMEGFESRQEAIAAMIYRVLLVGEWPV